MKAPDKQRLNRLLGISCVFKNSFSLDWMVQLTGYRPSEVLELLNYAAEKQILVENGKNFYRVATVQERERYLAGLSRDEKRRLHDQIAEILIQELPDAPDKGKRLAPHLMASENDLQRCRWLYTAGQNFLNEYHVSDALDCFSKIFDDLSRFKNADADALFIDTSIKYAKYASIQYDIGKIIQTLRDAIDNAMAIGDNNKLPLLYMLLAHNEWLRGNFSHALRHFETGRQKSENIESPAVKMYAATFSIYFYFWQGRFAGAVQEYEKKIPEGDRLPNGGFPYFPGIIVGYCYAQCGHIEFGMKMIQAVRLQGIKKQAHFLTVAATILLACLMLLYQRIDEAFEYIEDAERIGRKSGLEVVFSFCNLAYAYAFYQQASYLKASEFFERFWQRKNEHEQVIQWLYPILLELAHGIQKGDLPATKAFAEQQEIRAAINSSNLFYSGLGHRYEAFRMQKAGEPILEVIDHLKQSQALLQQSGSVIEELRTLTELVVFFRRIESSDKITHTRERIRQLLSRISIPYIPKRFHAFLDKTYADSIIVNEILEMGKTVLDGEADTEDLLDAMVAPLCHIIGAERAALVKLEGEHAHAFRVLVCRNLTPEIFSRDMPEWLAKLMADATESPAGFIRSLIKTQACGDSEMPRSVICKPLIIYGQISAILYFDHRVLKQAFSEREQRLLDFFAIMIASILGQREAKASLGRLKKQYAEEKLDHDGPPPDKFLNGKEINIVGRSAAIKNVISMIERVADTDAAVLITGETGVGKELVAKAIHQSSSRSKNPFITVNCNAIPATIIASELFGHEKGAFTGANTRRMGRFESADGGSLFMDEIGDLPLDIQVGLLRILQTKEFERVGSSETLTSDFRLIAATNQDLEKAVARGGFRRDLFYRLNVFPLYVPPLRERKEDIPLIAHHLLKIYAARFNKRFDRFPEAEMDKLLAYNWPGNVRELENVIQRGVIMSSGRVFTVPPIQMNFPEPIGHAPRGFDVSLSLREVEKAHIKQALETAGGKIRGKGGAAEMLDINPSTLRSRMKKLGIARD